MKFLLYNILIVIIILSCSNEEAIKSREIKITVINQKTKKPIENSLVQLTTIVNGTDIYIDSNYTDSTGNCKYLIQFIPKAYSKIRAMKDGYIDYFECDTTDFNKAAIWLTKNINENIILFLTSDTMNHINYWKKISVRFEIDMIIHLLKTKQYRYHIPQLYWEDIPVLLAVGNDTTMVMNVPQNPVSSRLYNKTYLGIVALWFIESIRITEKKILQVLWQGIHLNLP